MWSSGRLALALIVAATPARAQEAPPSDAVVVLLVADGIQARDLERRRPDTTPVARGLVALRTQGWSAVDAEAGAIGAEAALFSLLEGTEGAALVRREPGRDGLAAAVRRGDLSLHHLTPRRSDRFAAAADSLLAAVAARSGRHLVLLHHPGLTLPWSVPDDARLDALDDTPWEGNAAVRTMAEQRAGRRAELAPFFGRSELPPSPDPRLLQRARDAVLEESDAALTEVLHRATAQLGPRARLGFTSLPTADPAAPPLARETVHVPLFLLGLGGAVEAAPVSHASFSRALAGWLGGGAFAPAAGGPRLSMDPARGAARWSDAHLAWVEAAGRPPRLFDRGLDPDERWDVVALEPEVATRAAGELWTALAGGALRLSILVVGSDNPDLLELSVIGDVDAAAALPSDLEELDAANAVPSGLQLALMTDAAGDRVVLPLVGPVLRLAQTRQPILDDEGPLPWFCGATRLAGEELDLSAWGSAFLQALAAPDPPPRSRGIHLELSIAP